MNLLTCMRAVVLARKRVRAESEEVMRRNESQEEGAEGMDSECERAILRFGGVSDEAEVLRRREF